jgi:hypothetical protein
MKEDTIYLGSQSIEMYWVSASVFLIAPKLCSKANLYLGQS